MSSKTQMPTGRLTDHNPSVDSTSKKKKITRFIFSNPVSTLSITSQSVPPITSQSVPPITSQSVPPITSPSVPPITSPSVPPASEYGPKLRALNKKLQKAFKAGRSIDAKKYILEGASIAFLNYDGILSAAEEGKYKVIEMIFKELDYKTLIKNDILEEMIMSTAPDLMNHTKLHKFLLQYRGLCPNTIENENLNGFIDDIACNKECSDI